MKAFAVALLAAVVSTTAMSQQLPGLGSQGGRITGPDTISGNLFRTYQSQQQSERNQEPPRQPPSVLYGNPATYVRVIDGGKCDQKNAGADALGISLRNDHTSAVLRVIYDVSAGTIDPSGYPVPKYADNRVLAPGQTVSLGCYKGDMGTSKFDGGVVNVRQVLVVS